MRKHNWAGEWADVKDMYRTAKEGPRVYSWPCIVLASLPLAMWNGGALLGTLWGLMVGPVTAEGLAMKKRAERTWWTLMVIGLAMAAFIPLLWWAMQGVWPSSILAGTLWGLLCVHDAMRKHRQ